MIPPQTSRTPETGSKSTLLRPLVLSRWSLWPWLCGCSCLWLCLAVPVRGGLQQRSLLCCGCQRLRLSAAVPMSALWSWLCRAVCVWRLQLPRYWITEKLLPAMGHETRTPDMGHETAHETSHETGTPDIGHETAHETMANPKPMKPP